MSGQIWAFFDVSSVTLQNNREKMNEKRSKMTQIDWNMVFMSSNALQHVLICISLHHFVIWYIFFVYLLIFEWFMMRFFQKTAFFWKMAIIWDFILACACARARRAGYLGEYRSDQSEIWRDDSLGYLQQI